ncbi:hypothetical protein SPOG_00341 [Schizosaccharomyces cryophilus OY26]|uniref:Uncharacterized protein n=1 Tax=Schizosaccharomyces cryophilus (strain OY26 / ATCC MYA-4695 / CBS 11777 / NBRC 106824 / NRRL Y48691) TaxID=653667 RepID=S9W0I0_SCHCR|nr:uncharacterized protein SPOG_00341 [Schizosaccharomyces cryophilus OY26]EPY51919.1 hypothetical protein SPOG_00341 [Schizosaccharomyces cryophilus OY26]
MERNSSGASRLNSTEQSSTSNTKLNARQLLSIQVPQPIPIRNDPFGFDSVKGVRLSSTLESDSSVLRSANQAVNVGVTDQDGFERILSSSPPVVNENEFLKNVEDPHSFNLHSRHPPPLSASSPKQVPLPASSPPNFSSTPSSPIPMSSVTTSSMHPPSSSKLSSRSSFPKEATTRQLERFVPIPHGNLKKRLRQRPARRNNEVDLSILHTVPNSSPLPSASESESGESETLWKQSKRMKLSRRQSDSSFTLDNENLNSQYDDNKRSTDGSSSDEDQEGKKVLDDEQQKRMEDLRQYFQQIDQYKFQVVDD